MNKYVIHFFIISGGKLGMAAAAGPMLAGMMSGNSSHGHGQMYGQGHNQMYGQGPIPAPHQQRYVKDKDETTNENKIEFEIR